MYSISDIEIDTTNKYDSFIDEIRGSKVGDMVKIDDYEFELLMVEYFDDNKTSDYIEKKIIPSDKFVSDKEKCVEYAKDYSHMIYKLELKINDKVSLYIINMRGVASYMKHWCWYIVCDEQYINIDKFNHSKHGISSNVSFSNASEIAYDSAHYDVFEIETPYDKKICTDKLGNKSTGYVINLARILKIFIEKEHEDDKSLMDLLLSIE